MKGGESFLPKQMAVQKVKTANWNLTMALCDNLVNEGVCVIWVALAGDFVITFHYLLVGFSWIDAHEWHFLFR